MDDPAGQRPTPTPLPALIAGFAALYLLWGSTYLGIKFAVETLPPLMMAGARFLLSGILLYVVLRLRGVSAPTKPQWRLGAWTGALLLVGGNGLVTVGQMSVPSGQAALLVATTPLWMVLLSWLFYAGERPGIRVWLGMMVGFAGAVMLIKPSASGQTGTLVGSLMLLAAPIAWSLGSLESRRRRPNADILMTSAMQMLTGGAMMLLLGLGRGEGSALLTQTVSLKSALAFVYLAFCGGLIGFSTYAWLLQVASPTVVSTYAYVNPLVAVLLGWGIAGEILDSTVILAASLIVGAVILITLPKNLRIPVLRKRGEILAIPVMSTTCPPREVALKAPCTR